MSERRFDPMTGEPIDQPTENVNPSNQPVNQQVGNINQVNQPVNQQAGNVNQANQPQWQNQQSFNGAPQNFGAQQGQAQQGFPGAQQNQAQGQFGQQFQQQQGAFAQQGNFQQQGGFGQPQFGNGAQPFGGNNVPPQGNDKKKLFIIGGIVAAFVILLIVFNVVIVMNRGKKDDNAAIAASEEATVPTPVFSQEDDESTDEATTEATEAVEEKEEEKEEQASVPHTEADPNAISSFSAYGKTYSLPVRVQELIDDGWQFNKDSDAKILLGSGDYEIVYLLTPDEKPQQIDVHVTNFSIDAKELGEGYITEITFYNFIVDKTNMDLSFHGGDLKLNESTKEDVVAIFGDADRDYDGSTSYSITYEVANDTDLMTRVETTYNFEKENDKLSRVSLTNQEKPSDMGEEQVSGDEPEYLSKYKAPSSLGDDLLSGNISISGKVYNVPVPLKVLMEDGWSFGGDETDTVGADSGYAITLAKGDERLYVTAYNFTTSACYMKYTIVTSITYYPSSYHKLEIELPGGIKGTSTKDDLEALLSSKGITNYEYDKSYGRYTIPLDQNDRNRIDIHVSDDGKMESIEVRNIGWILE